MKKIAKSKLSLTQEVIRNLSTDELGAVGGGGNTKNACTNNGSGCNATAQTVATDYCANNNTNLCEVF